MPAVEGLDDWILAGGALEDDEAVDDGIRQVALVLVAGWGGTFTELLSAAATLAEAPSLRETS